MSKILTPESNRQFHQLFTDDRFKIIRNSFCNVILRKLKFRDCPRCGDKMVRETINLVNEDLDDDEIYDALHEFVHEELFESKEYLESLKTYDKSFRERNRTQALEIILKKYLRNNTIESYLDVGCGDGSITRAIGDLLDAENINGCDVIQLKDEYDFNFKLLDPKNPFKLPYKDKSQDVVTALMSLHHIEKVDETLDEINRVLKDDGIFIIREHDNSPDELSLLLDLMHGFYAMVWKDPREMEDFTEHYSCYRNVYEMKKLINSHNFMNVYQGQIKGAWGHYYSIFIKRSSNQSFKKKVRTWFRFYRR